MSAFSQNRTFEHCARFKDAVRRAYMDGEEDGPHSYIYVGLPLRSGRRRRDRLRSPCDPLLRTILNCGITAKVGFKSCPAFNFAEGVLFDRENRTFRQELNTVGDAAAQSRFDVSETAGTNDNHVYIVLLGARDNCACDRAFPHYRHYIVNALLARPFLRMCNQFSRKVVSDQCPTSLGSANVRLWLLAAVRAMPPVRPLYP